MADLVLTNVYIDQDQKNALVRKAEARGSDLSLEIRRAIDVYLAGVSEEELSLLDAATRQAKIELDEMVRILDAGLERSKRFFTEIEKIKSQQPQ